jgi:hypothetical protein
LLSLLILLSIIDSTVGSPRASVLNVLDGTCLTDKDRVKADLDGVYTKLVTSAYKEWICDVCSS